MRQHLFSSDFEVRFEVNGIIGSVNLMRDDSFLFSVFLEILLHAFAESFQLFIILLSVLDET